MRIYILFVINLKNKKTIHLNTKWYSNIIKSTKSNIFIILCLSIKVLFFLFTWTIIKIDKNMFLPSFLNKIWHIEEILSLLILSIRKFQQNKIILYCPLNHVGPWLATHLGCQLGLVQKPKCQHFYFNKSDRAEQLSE